MIQIPPALQKGDIVAIAATARKISMTEIAFAKQWLTDLGYEVVLGTTIGLEFNQFAGTDIQRAEDFQKLLNNKKVKAIWCARGGYGTVRIVDLIDFSVLKKQPKWIIGYSDITVLHSQLHCLGIASIHASMPIDIEAALAEAKDSLVKVLKGESVEVNFENTENNKLGKATGIAIGGNLSVLYSLCGSDSVLQTKGKILFLEDLDEYYYHIDRMLQNLKRNGMLKDLAALVIGGMTKMHDNAIPFGYSIPEMILEIVKEYNYPVVFDAPFGHQSDNRAVVFGKQISLNASTEKVTIEGI